LNTAARLRERADGVAELVRRRAAVEKTEVHRTLIEKDADQAPIN